LRCGTLTQEAAHSISSLDLDLQTCRDVRGGLQHGNRVAEGKCRKELGTTFVNRELENETIGFETVFRNRQGLRGAQLACRKQDWETNNGVSSSVALF